METVMMTEGGPIMNEMGDEATANGDLIPPPDYQLYMDMPDWKNVPSPPSYEEAVLFGMNDSSNQTAYNNTQQQEGSTLGYVDFLPRLINQIGSEPEYEEFRVLMTMANDWLRRFPQYSVLRCESIERHITKTGFLEAETTIQHTAAYGINAFVRGLRLWLTWNTSQSPPQQIWYMNILPKPIPQTIYYGRSMNYGIGMVNNYAMTVNKTTIYPDFEDLDATVEKLNAKLKEKPIPGSVLNIECKDMKYCSNMWDPKIYNPNKHPYNPDKGYWGDMKESGIFYLTVIRIFFIQGSPQPVQIGFQDFAPQCVRYVVGGKPIFEPLSQVVANCNSWIMATRDVKVTNIGTLQTKVTASLFGEDKEKIGYNSKCTFYSAGNFEVTYVNFIRVAFIKPGRNDYVGVSVKSFVPIRYSGNKESEPLAEMLYRINTWLAVTGARVKGAVTLQMEFSPSVKKAINMEKTSSTVQASKGCYWITVIQLYLNGQYVEPPYEVLPPAPDYVLTDNSSGGCNLL